MTIKKQRGNNTSKTRVSNLDSLEGQQDPQLRFTYLPLSTTPIISLICSTVSLIASNLVTTSINSDFHHTISLELCILHRFWAFWIRSSVELYI